MNTSYLLSGDDIFYVRDVAEGDQHVLMARLPDFDLGTGGKPAAVSLIGGAVAMNCRVAGMGNIEGRLTLVLAPPSEESARESFEAIFGFREIHNSVILAAEVPTSTNQPSSDSERDQAVADPARKSDRGGRSGN